MLNSFLLKFNKAIKKSKIFKMLLIFILLKIDQFSKFKIFANKSNFWATKESQIIELKEKLKVIKSSGTERL